MSKKTFSFAFCFSIFFSFFILCLANDNVANWTKFNLLHQDYVKWKQNGGSLKPNFRILLGQDRYSDETHEGVSFEGLKKKFPFLVEHHFFPEDSYKKGAIRKNTRVLWFSKKDNFDWCFMEIEGKIHLRLIKG